MALARLCLVAALSGALALCTFSNADAAATDWVGDGHAAVRLITATDSLATAPALDAALEFRFGKGWHGYWRTPGDAGIAPAIDWSGSDNIAGGEVAWPAPHRLVIEGLQNSVYEKQVVLPIKLSLKHTGLATGIRAMMPTPHVRTFAYPTRPNSRCRCRPEPARSLRKPSSLRRPADPSRVQRKPPESISSPCALRAARLSPGSSWICVAKTGRSSSRICLSRVSARDSRQHRSRFSRGRQAAHLTVAPGTAPGGEADLTLTDGDRAGIPEFPAGASRSAH